MKYKKKVILLAIAFSLFIAFMLNLSNKPTYAYIPFALPENFELPDSQMLAVGMCTHGNTEPLEAALQMLKRIKEKYGSVAFILEENVGAATLINRNHSFFDAESRRTIGFYDIYAGQALSDLLAWLEDENVRMYGIDIQSIDITRDLLYTALSELEYSQKDKVFALLRPESKAEERFSLLEDIGKFLLKALAEGSLNEREYDEISHLLDTVEMCSDYTNADYPEDSSIREKLMAKNALWVLAHESKYYDNTHVLLLASNGHVTKCSYYFGYDNTPMGYYLSNSLESDYFSIVTEAKNNVFYARNKIGKKVFKIERTGSLIDISKWEDKKVLYKTATDLLHNGITEWSLTTVGWYFTNARGHSPKWYAVDMELPGAYDAMLLFQQLTPNRAEN